MRRLKGRNRQSIHMPRWASRITLEVTDVRVERINEIGNEDIEAEGIERGTCDCPTDPPGYGHRGLCAASDAHIRWGFRNLWNAINAKRGFGWESNPWVWVVGFRRLADA